MFLHLVLFGDIVSAEKLGQWIFICNSSLNSHGGSVLAIQRKNEKGQMWRSNFKERASCNSNLVECINSFPFPLDSWAYPSYQVGTPQIFILDLRFNKMEQICYLTTFELFRDFLSGSAGKESCLQWGRSPGEGKGYPLQYSGLENSMDCIVHGVAELDTTEWLSLSLFTHALNMCLTLWVKKPPARQET